ncbi:MAG TPA: geopeptide radical SAM maturase [Geobacteraceae bacterium]|nr:geopeptide radical SAM maturase [Geobacteraceae bacterium]
MHISHYVKIFSCRDDPGRVLLYSTLRGASVVVPESLLMAIEEGTIAHGDRETLTRLGYLVPDGELEKSQMRDALAEANRRSRRFSAQVVVNLNCNLACTYCYEGGMKGHRYMSAGTADLLAELMEKEGLAAGKDIELSFYGGEPLMSDGLIISLSERLRAAATARGGKYTFNLVTNGTLLTRQMVDMLLPLGLTGAKVTLDGPRENHDRFRPFVSGKGSFDTIIANVKGVCDLIRVQVGGNFTRDNYREFPALLDYLLAEGLTPERLALVKFDPVTKSGGNIQLPDFNEGCASLDEPWIWKSALFLREEILRRGFHTPRIQPTVCTIESCDDIVVNWDGTLYKCPAFLGWEGMEVGSLAKGIGDYAASHNLDVWKKDECLDCAYLPLCFGGCRYLKLLRDGRLDCVDCRKGFLDATLEKFVRMDLKYRPRKK